MRVKSSRKQRSSSDSTYRNNDTPSGSQKIEDRLVTQQMNPKKLSDQKRKNDLKRLNKFQTDIEKAGKQSEVKANKKSAKNSSPKRDPQVAQALRVDNPFSAQ